MVKDGLERPSAGETRRATSPSLGERQFPLEHGVPLLEPVETVRLLLPKRETILRSFVVAVLTAMISFYRAGNEERAARLQEHLPGQELVSVDVSVAVESPEAELISSG